MHERHGQRTTPLYSKWRNMLKRCNAPSYIGYKHYGGRGISICPEWQNSFVSFAKWAEISGYADNLTLDRIDNNGDYTPANCKWSTMQEQAVNKRPLSNNTSGVTGIHWCKHAKKWIARIQNNGSLICLGNYEYKTDAIIARNNSIISNGLPHKLIY